MPSGGCMSTFHSFQRPNRISVCCFSFHPHRRLDASCWCTRGNSERVGCISQGRIKFTIIYPFGRSATGSSSPTETSWCRVLHLCALFWFLLSLLLLLFVFFILYRQPQNPLVLKALRSMRVILSNGCFLAGTTSRVLKPEWRLFFTAASSPTFLLRCRLPCSLLFVQVTFADNPTKHYPQKDGACLLAQFQSSIIIILCHQCRETVDHHRRSKLVTQSRDLNLSLLEIIFSAALKTEHWTLWTENYIGKNVSSDTFNILWLN